MNSEGLNNLLKVVELVRGKLGFESWCIRPVESLRVNFTEALVGGENLFGTAAFCHGRAFGIMDLLALFNNCGN